MTYYFYQKGYTLKNKTKLNVWCSNFYDKEKYVLHIRTLDQVLDEELVSKKLISDKIESKGMTKTLLLHEY